MYGIPLFWYRVWLGYMAAYSRQTPPRVTLRLVVNNGKRIDQ